MGGYKGEKKIFEKGEFSGYYNLNFFMRDWDYRKNAENTSDSSCQDGILNLFYKSRRLNLKI